jgi:hypothetical protein
VILMLRCREVDGVGYLLSDIALSCETKEYAQYHRFALCGVLFFPVGIVVLFTSLVHRQRHNMPPDWWPKEEPQKAKEAYVLYRKEVGRSMAKPFAAWKSAVWDEDTSKFVKNFKRYGFLFAAYTTRFWWFESLITLYKLCMTVLVVFISDKDEAKILFGMVGATLMMGCMSFFQPFKHSGILSINSMAQLVILMTLFTASYLLLNNGGNAFTAVFLVMLTLAPLVAGVGVIARLPEGAIVAGADDMLLSVAQKQKKRGGQSPSFRGKRANSARANSDASDASDASMTDRQARAGADAETFAFSNPMMSIHRTQSQEDRESMRSNPMHQRTKSRGKLARAASSAAPSDDEPPPPPAPAPAPSPINRQVSLTRGPAHLPQHILQDDEERGLEQKTL